MPSSNHDGPPAPLWQDFGLSWGNKPRKKTRRKRGKEKEKQTTKEKRALHNTISRLCPGKILINKTTKYYLGIFKGKRETNVQTHIAKPNVLNRECKNRQKQERGEAYQGGGI